MTQPCPSPVSAGPVWQRELCVQEGWAACSQSSGKHCRAEMVSDPVAPRPLWPLLGFTLKRSQSTRCCWHWCLCRGVQLSGSAVFPGERIINKCLSQHFPKGKYPSVPNQTPVLCHLIAVWGISLPCPPSPSISHVCAVSGLLSL